MNVLKSVASGKNTYEEGKTMLQVAIEEYDQAVFDLTASVVAGSLPQIRS